MHPKLELMIRTHNAIVTGTLADSQDRLRDMKDLGVMWRMAGAMVDAMPQDLKDELAKDIEAYEAERRDKLAI